MQSSLIDLEKALLAWINTFRCPDSPLFKTLIDLKDGIFLNDVMNKLHQKYFETDKLTRDCSNNWALVHKNLGIFYQSIQKYYVNVLHKPFDSGFVDILAISKNNDLSQMTNLLELILGAVVQCENKEIYIENILTLEENDQAQLMHIISKILSKSKGSEDMHQVEMDDISSIHAQNDRERKLLMKIDELEAENQSFITKIQEITDEKESLQQKYMQMNEINDELAKKCEQMKRSGFGTDSDDYETTIKIKDNKLSEMNDYVTQLKKNHQIQINNLQDEIEAKKKKILQYQRLESSLDYYKQKYEDYTRLVERKNEMDKRQENMQQQLSESEERQKFLENKISKYKEKITEEKNKIINYELELSRKNQEIEHLKCQNREHEDSISKSEVKINDLVSYIESIGGNPHGEHMERSDSMTKPSNLANELNDIIQNIENKMSDISKKDKPGNQEKERIDLNDDLEILQRENQLLITKCKEIQTDNENLRQEMMKTSTTEVKLLKEVEKLKEEVQKQKHSSRDLANKEILQDNRRLTEEVNKLKESMVDKKVDFYSSESDGTDYYKGIINEKSQLINNLHQKIINLEDENKVLRNKQSDEEMQKVNEQLYLTRKELESIKSLKEDLDEEKSEEIRILVSILFDLRMKYQELQTSGTTSSHHQGPSDALAAANHQKIKKK